ncbi:MAG: short-chain dehydrogenase/reductase [Planctomycetes bacterium]|jgi:NAD(P)-dependent dehydrogenase (short-subunit alcohol dehydrogenase family)|nr:short-chain dehydrogenase/reductase [Planctomycetota bacterium]
MTERTVLTTGANGAIGLATVLDVAARGHRSIGTVRSQSAARAVERAARARGLHIETRLLDVNDVDGCVEVIESIRPDVLVNNAGYALFGAIETTPEEAARKLIETQLFSPVRLARLALPFMRDRRWGRILFMSSLFGRVGAPPLGWYAASKHAIEGIADVLRMEIARDGIDVIVIEPGGVQSNMLDKAQQEGLGHEASEYAEFHQTTRRRLRQTDFLRADPKLVSRVVVEAIEATRPEPRYLVGLDAQIIGRLAPIIPSWLSDRVTRFVLRL